MPQINPSNSMGLNPTLATVTQGMSAGVMPADALSQDRHGGAPSERMLRERLQRHRRRKWINQLALMLSVLAMAFGMVWLLWILWDTVRLGLAGLSAHVFSLDTPPPMAEMGGLRNAILGSLMMTVVATLVGTPIGILSGIYLAEYAGKSWLGRVVGFVNDILLSAPSIVIGLFIYYGLVAPVKTFSGWAGSLALALIVIPVVIRTTENMLTLVPSAMREAAYALGTPRWKVILLITLRAARSGVITGILLAVARISGETAPLLFTSLNNQFFSADMGQPMANLPVTIFQFAMSPYENWQVLAWAGVFIITMSVLALNIVARVFFRSKN